MLREVVGVILSIIDGMTMGSNEGTMVESIGGNMLGCVDDSLDGESV